jgi:hypothetical protein
LQQVGEICTMPHSQLYVALYLFMNKAALPNTAGNLIIRRWELSEEKIRPRLSPK